MVCRPVSFVQDLNLLMMDRLLHREHWVEPDERYQCNTCFQYFHLDPKKHCYMCGEIVCGDCRTRLLIEGRYMNDVGVMAFHHGFTAKVCHPCYFTFFSARAVGFFEVEKHPNRSRPSKKKLPSSHPSKPPRRPTSDHPPPSSGSLTNASPTKCAA
ncbi:hypothetical protein, variant [Saprolegnia diclina VS20]|uniref:FYVE-type domain-containing protein n=1 Tax=Saprolegnia diclina (strain VS20) TaxID=1156394 RepID=T0RRE9_SAPDV|nr:hypothetical protein, variant [Saprolegnia diclina VS20]EQC35013.1 hypothetical protein, variant [Saprolegnia diclina VS20]|eukprot:XP_008611297.1 hypothetical protein, variant [Saprolegnia diclina VS20]